MIKAREGGVTCRGGLMGNIGRPTMLHRVWLVLPKSVAMVAISCARNNSYQGDQIGMTTILSDTGQEATWYL